MSVAGLETGHTVHRARVMPRGDLDPGRRRPLRTGPGELHQLWVVDVDGEISVIDAASFRGTPVADVEELERIIGSIAVER